MTWRRCSRSGSSDVLATPHPRPAQPHAPTGIALNSCVRALALPLKSEYRPTLGELLAPRWRRASALWRVLVVAAAAALAVALVTVVLTAQSPTVSHGGPVPFSFAYRGLYRTSPEPGGYTKVQRLRGRLLEDSFAVGPLTLPPYTGEPSGALALFAVRYIRGLAAAHRGFELRGEGTTQIDSVAPYATYNVFYTTRVQGREMYGRDVLLLAERPGARRGVAITMLTAAAGNPQVTSPLDVGVKGPLEEPLGTFALE